MTQVTPIIVKRGFLSALVYGISGTLITALICGSGVGLYFLNILDRKTGDVVSIGRDVVKAIPAIRESLPPVLADAINDRREPAYRSQVDVQAKLVDSVSRKTEADGDTADREHRRSLREDIRALVTVQNNGPETVSLLALRITGLDSEGVPLFERIQYAATPLAIDDEMRGPLMADAAPRKLVVRVPADARLESVTAEITDLRVWRPQPEPSQTTASRGEGEQGAGG